MLKGKKKLIILTSICVIAVAAAAAALSVYMAGKNTEPAPQPVAEAEATPEPVPTPEITPVPTKDPNEGKVKSALTGEYISKKSSAVAKSATLKQAPKSTLEQNLAHDSANQWYTASRPLKAAPKLSDFSPGQTVKLKPAPGIKQALKQPIITNAKQKHVI